MKIAIFISQLSILVSYLCVLNQTTACDHQPNCFRFILGLSGFIIKITYLLYPLRNLILQILHTLHNYCHFRSKTRFSVLFRQKQYLFCYCGSKIGSEFEIANEFDVKMGKFDRNVKIFGSILVNFDKKWIPGPDQNFSFT